MTRRSKRKNLRPQRHCIFCGGARVDREHLWSQWMHDLLADVKTREKGSAREIGSIDENGKHHHSHHLEPVKVGQGSTLTVKIKAQCQRCNSGWMSGLETEVKPFLGPMIEGRTVTLTKVQQVSLAAWATLKAMVAEHHHERSKVALPPEYEHLMCHRQPPTNWLVWVGSHNSVEWRAQYHHEGLTVPLPGLPFKTVDGAAIRNLQSTTFGFGPVVFYAVSAVPEFQLNLETHLDRFGLQRIWPVDSETIAWPVGALTWGHVEGLCRALGDAVRAAGLVPNAGR